MPRTLSEKEFEIIKDSVLESAPEGLTEAEFYRYVGPKFEEAIGVAENSPQPIDGSSVSRFLGPVLSSLNPVTAVTAVIDAAKDLKGTAAGIVGQMGGQWSQAKDLAGQGRYVEAAGRAAAGSLPIVGPMAAGAADAIVAGDVAGGLGTVAGLAAPVAVGKGIAKVIPKRIGPVVSSKLNPVEAAAVEFGQKRGIPLDAATATGSPTLRAAQKRVANTIGGEGTAEKLIASQEANLRRVGGELAEQANVGDYVTPELAGEGIKTGVQGLVGTMNEIANEAYGKLRKIEEDPRFAQQVHQAPKGSRSYQNIIKKLESGGQKVNENELYALRQMEAELDAMPFSKRMLKQTEKGNSWEPVEGVGGAGAPVYHEIAQAMSEGADLTRAEMQAAIKKTLETGEWTNAAKGALEVARKRLKMPMRPSGPSLSPDAPLLGGVEEIKLPVALSNAKKALEPLYDRLKRESELVPLMGDKGRALVALDRLLNGPENAPVSIVDAALGDLKAMARADIPELRTQGQGLAAMAVKELDKAVRDAAAKGGPEAVSALEEGRAATVAKYQAGDVLEKIRAEPVQAFRQMTAPKDSGIAMLRQVRELAPGKIPDVARAYLEDLMGTATAEGGFGRAARLQSEWQKLGPETKRALFPDPGHVASLDNFFLLAKRIAENPNPSGTAHNLTVFNVASTLPAWMASKVLYTPSGVRALTRAYQLSLQPKVSGATKTAATMNLIRAGRAAGVDLSVLPAMAEQDSE